MMRTATLGIVMTLVSCAGPCKQDATPVREVRPAPRSEAAAPLATRLEELRKGGRRDVTYRPPTPDEERAYAAWVDVVVRAAIAGTPPNAAPPPGFSLERIGDLWLLAERPEAKRGAGAIVIREGAAAPVLVQAPHTFFDVGTLPVALDAFDAGRCRALSINTVHRYAAGRGDENGDDEGGDAISDVAHTTASFFLAGHRALLAAQPGAWTVQLHGFGDDRAPGVSAILSASVTNASIVEVTARARSVLGDDVRRYPDDIRVLGALRNVEASACRDAGAPFLHVEMSRTLRDKLGDDAELRRRAAAAFLPVGAP